MILKKHNDVSEKTWRCFCIAVPVLPIGEIYQHRRGIYFFHATATTGHFHPEQTVHRLFYPFRRFFEGKKN